MYVNAFKMICGQRKRKSFRVIHSLHHKEVNSIPVYMENGMQWTCSECGTCFIYVDKNYAVNELNGNKIEVQQKPSTKNTLVDNNSLLCHHNGISGAEKKKHKKHSFIKFSN